MSSSSPSSSSGDDDDDNDNDDAAATAATAAPEPAVTTATTATNESAAPSEAPAGEAPGVLGDDPIAIARPPSVRPQDPVLAAEVTEILARRREQSAGVRFADDVDWIEPAPRRRARSTRRDEDEDEYEDVDDGDISPDEILRAGGDNGGCAERPACECAEGAKGAKGQDDGRPCPRAQHGSRGATYPPTAAAAPSAGNAAQTKPKPRQRKKPTDDSEQSGEEAAKPAPKRRSFPWKPELDEHGKPIPVVRRKRFLDENGKPILTKTPGTPRGFWVSPQARMRSTEGEEMTRTEFDLAYPMSTRRWLPGGRIGGGRYEIIATGVVWSFVVEPSDYQQQEPPQSSQPAATRPLLPAPTLSAPESSSSAAPTAHNLARPIIGLSPVIGLDDPTEQPATQTPRPPTTTGSTRPNAPTHPALPAQPIGQPAPPPPQPAQPSSPRTAARVAFLDERCRERGIKTRAQFASDAEFLDWLGPRLEMLLVQLGPLDGTPGQDDEGH
ncbi:ec3f75af-c5bd-43bf-a871-62e6bff16ce3 [Thermothielavioides terrestris]|uniref:Ec3f75af-c5bd-43bf-a871-62e6bff16ce3 n=1 Tax=Thermothielavioides terrestris TaxID=2587410 RepID=A0A446BRV2_9PEZI|nr:ec3f75af-c5bd-43bf-a871-62e6bff16ce3 [Thermothielavioides terrestris]